jgi:hypothetical protein
MDSCCWACRREIHNRNCASEGLLDLRLQKPPHSESDFKALIAVPFQSLGSGRNNDAVGADGDALTWFVIIYAERLISRKGTSRNERCSGQ